MNAPPRHELFLLGEGEKKITWVEDSRVPNTSIFTFNKEDHTLGNLLSSRLRTKDHVSFSGYIVGHPLVPKFELRVGTDGSMTPKDAIIQVCKEILLDLDIVSREFTKEMELFKIAHPETMADLDGRGADGHM